MLPRAPRRIDAASIASALAAHGIATHVRTVQRDLVELAEVFPISVDERSKPYGWRWTGELAFPSTLPVALAPRAQGHARDVAVTIRVARAAQTALLEALRARDAALSPDAHDAGSVIVRAMMADSPSLRRVVLGFADSVEVIEPRALRLEIAEAARRTAQRYGRS